jgi:hypothetical protein
VFQLLLWAQVISGSENGVQSGEIRWTLQFQRYCSDHFAFNSMFPQLAILSHQIAVHRVVTKLGCPKTVVLRFSNRF